MPNGARSGGLGALCKLNARRALVTDSPGLRGALSRPTPRKRARVVMACHERRARACPSRGVEWSRGESNPRPVQPNCRLYVCSRCFDLDPRSTIDGLPLDHFAIVSRPCEFAMDSPGQPAVFSIRPARRQERRIVPLMLSSKSELRVGSYGFAHLITRSTCAATRHDSPNLSGRNQSAPDVKEHLMIARFALERRRRRTIRGASSWVSG